MTRFIRIPRAIRRPIVLGAMLLLVTLISAPAASALPAGQWPPGGGVPTPPDPLPDLIVERVTFGNAGPYLGDYVEATIRNQSNHDVFDGFYVRDDASWNKTVRVNGLAAGSFVRVRFYYDDTCEGSSTIYADAFRQIQESNESNNSRFWVLVC